MMSTAVVSCGRGLSDGGTSGEAGPVTVTPDSIIAPGGLVYACGDSVVRRDADGRIVALYSIAPPSEGVALECGDTLIQAIFNSTCAGVMPEAGFPSQSVVNAAGLSYPVTASPDVDTAFELWRDFLMTGNSRSEAAAYKMAHGIMLSDESLRFDAGESLYRGETAAEAVADRTSGMQADEIAANYSLLNNLRHIRLIDIILTVDNAASQERQLMRERRARLVNAVNTRFWMPVQSNYGRLIYGAPAQLLLEEPSVDALSLAVLSEVATPPMRKAMMRKMLPAADSLMACTVSQSVAVLGTAACRSGNQNMAYKALSELMVRSCMGENRQEAAEALQSMVVSGIFGITPTVNGLSFAPLVPSRLTESRRLRGFAYREAVLDIEINGCGDVISTFAIDGETRGLPLVPPDLRGVHTVTITLVGASEGAYKEPVKAVGYYPVFSTADSARLYVMNEYIGPVTPTEFASADYPTPMWYNFVYNPVEGCTPRSMSTHLVVAPSDSLSFSVASMSRPGARTLRDKALSRIYSESTRFKNRSIAFDYDAPAEGDYLLMITYFNGLGIVNPMRSYVLRTLAVNGKPGGLVVFPQLEPSDWDVGADWQTLRGTTIPATIHLKSGRNRISLDYYAPDDENFDHDANTLIADRIILVNLKH